MKNKKQAKILASGVYQAIKNKQKKEVDSVVDNFVVYLKEKRLMATLPGVIEELEALYFEEQGIIKAQISAKTDLPAKNIEAIEEILNKKTGQKIITEQVKDDEVLGGVVVKYNDKIIDMSLKRQLNNLAKQLSN
ncbi:ATP synthase F1 subunit delta [Candidatus Parcubacteria bacterium]|jgi:F-type H+-transporting ATPase subunit delta|nr:ATP synthase F1 subunit delta [Candidatus Parcubacteria bacterium]